MPVVIYEGIVQGGRIRLEGDVHLPEDTKVYVLVPDVPGVLPPRVMSPHLARPDQIRDFELEVREAPRDADVRRELVRTSGTTNGSGGDPTTGRPRRPAQSRGRCAFCS